MLTLPPTAYEPDWRNVDALPLEGVDEQVDLFAYPWPWEDNSITEIWASHIVEHIPHVPRIFQGALPLTPCAGWMIQRWDCLRDLDGFYAFFAEAYRVLKPGGTIGVVAPYGKSDGAMFDPQHTRFILESTFHYLGNGGNNSPTYAYSLPLNFEAVANPAFRFNPAFDKLTDEQKNSLLSTTWNVCTEILCTLRAIK